MGRREGRMRKEGQEEGVSGEERRGCGEGGRRVCKGGCVRMKERRMVRKEEG